MIYMTNLEKIKEYINVPDVKHKRWNVPKEIAIFMDDELNFQNDYFGSLQKELEWLLDGEPNSLLLKNFITKVNKIDYKQIKYDECKIACILEKGKYISKWPERVCTECTQCMVNSICELLSREWY